MTESVFTEVNYTIVYCDSSRHLHSRKIRPV